MKNISHKQNIFLYVLVLSIIPLLYTNHALAQNSKDMDFSTFTLIAEQSTMEIKNNVFGDEQAQGEDIADDIVPRSSNKKTKDNGLKNSKKSAKKKINPSEANDVLLSSARSGDLSQLMASMASGAAINSVDQHGNNALMLAIINGDNAVIDVLLRTDIDLNHRNNRGMTALWLAIMQENSPIAIALLAKKVDPDIPDKNGISPLMLTAIKNDVKTFNALLEKKADTKFGDINGKTALMYAIEYQSEFIIQKLSPDDPKDLLSRRFRVYKED